MWHQRLTSSPTLTEGCFSQARGSSSRSWRLYQTQKGNNDTMIAIISINNEQLDTIGSAFKKNASFCYMRVIHYKLQQYVISGG